MRLNANSPYLQPSRQVFASAGGIGPHPTASSTFEAVWLSWSALRPNTCQLTAAFGIVHRDGSCKPWLTC